MTFETHLVIVSAAVSFETHLVIVSAAVSFVTTLLTIIALAWYTSEERGSDDA